MTIRSSLRAAVRCVQGALAVARPAAQSLRAAGRGRPHGLSLHAMALVTDRRYSER